MFSAERQTLTQYEWANLEQLAYIYGGKQKCVEMAISAQILSPLHLLIPEITAPRGLSRWRAAGGAREEYKIECRCQPFIIADTFMHVIYIFPTGPMRNLWRPRQNIEVNDIIMVGTAWCMAAYQRKHGPACAPTRAHLKSDQAALLQISPCTDRKNDATAESFHKFGRRRK